MRDSRHSVLLIGLDDALARRVVVELNQFAPQFHRAPSADKLADHPWGDGCNVIIAHYAGDLSALEREAGRFAEWAGWSRPPALLVLCAPEWLEDVQPFIGRGVTRVILLEEIGTVLQEQVSMLFNAAPRYRIRLSVRLDAAASADLPPEPATTENLSLSGMLVRCPPGFSVGSAVRFALAIPGQVEPIRGTARIVRTTDPEREGLEGVGAAFESFVGSGHARLGGLMSSHLQ
jgi:hypothetical protein